MTPTYAAERWIELSTNHFQLYTSTDEAAARTAFRHFEQVRTFFLGASPFAKALITPVRIIAFQSESQYRPYHPSQSAASFYTRDPDHDYIVMQDLQPDHFNYAIHEFTHLLIARSDIHIPLWMNEGWADLNSTLTPKGRKAVIGDVIPGRRDSLLGKTWIPLADLDNIDTRSPMYNERDKANVFYGESWALVHMLYLSPEYRKKFDDFVQATVSGKSTSEALSTVYGKSPELVQQDLLKYFTSDKLEGALFAVNLDVSQEEPIIKQVGDVDLQLLLADLLVLTHKIPEAKTALESLITEYPESAPVQEALGYFDIKTGDRTEGIRHLKQAYDLGSTDAVMCYRLAVMLHATTTNRGAVVVMLRRALTLQPDYADARLQLGVTLLESQDYAGSLGELRLMSKITEANALGYFSASAIDNAKLGHPEEARKNADLARKWAKTPAQVSQVEQLLHSLDNK